jgi:hypothetical protein
MLSEYYVMLRRVKQGSKLSQTHHPEEVKLQLVTENENIQD